MSFVSGPVRQRWRSVLTGTLCVLLAGCAARLEVDGFVVSQDAYDYDVSILSARASTELDCPHGSLSFELLDVHSPVGLNVPQLFAVSGSVALPSIAACSSRRVHTRENGSSSHFNARQAMSPLRAMARLQQGLTVARATATAPAIVACSA